MTRTYVCRVSVGWALCAIVFFGACAAVFVSLLGQGDGVIINGIELGPGGTKVFYGVLLLASVGFVVMGVVGLVSPARELTITETELDIPFGFLGRRQRRITWSQIRRVEETSVSGTRILTLWTPDFKATVNNRTLSAEDYDEVASIVRERTGAR